MTWFVFAAGRRVAVPPGVPVWVGRDSDCDIVLDERRVSRKHLRVRVSDDQRSWQVTDESANGTFGADGPIDEASGDGLFIAALGNTQGPTVVISDDPELNVEAVTAGFAAVGLDEEVFVDSGSAGNLTMLEGVTRFGRALDNDVVLHGVLASAHHAHVIRSAG